MENKTAVVLFNLGGPDSLKAVQPFLYNLFSDPDIFKFPLGFISQRFFAWFISLRRAAQARQNYAAIGGKSPILENTQEQSIALQLSLAEEGSYDVYTCMRYWHPLTQEVVVDLKLKAYTDVILLPLYPQYSTTTTGSSVNEFMRQCKRLKYRPRITLIDHWFEQEDYQQAIVDCIKNEIDFFSKSDPNDIELLFSAHGLPEKIIKAGDPYQQHIEATFQAVTKKLGWPKTTLCYQSRVGPLQWIKPYTENVIKQKAEQGVKQLLVYPIAFVSDHVETLHELGIEYAELANQCGIEQYRVVPALNDHPLLIKTLKELVITPALQHAVT